jgi:hypothetical protein
MQSVESAKAMLALGRLLPRVEVLSQDEVDDSVGGHDHESSEESEGEEGELYESTDEDSDSESEDELTDEDGFGEGIEGEDGDSDASSVVDWQLPLA